MSKIASNIKALIIFFSVLQMSTIVDAQNDSLAGQVQLDLSSQFINDNKFDDASTSISKAINEIAENKQWDRLYNCGISYYQIWVRNKKFEVTSKLDNIIDILPEEQSLVKANILYLKGYFNNVLGNYNTSKGNYEEALPHLLTAKDTSKLAGCYGNLGIINIATQDYNSAISNLQKCINLFKEDASTVGIGRNLKNLGDAYFYSGDLKNAQLSYENSQKIVENTNGEYELKLALIELARSKNGAALQLGKTALEKAIIHKDTSVAAEIHLFLSEVYSKMNKPGLCNEQLSLAEDSYEKEVNKREKAKYFLQKAEILIQQKSNSKAIEAINTGLNVLVNGTFAMGKLSEYEPEINIAILLNRKGKILLEQGLEQNNLQLIKRANENNLGCIAKLEQIKSIYKDVHANYKLANEFDVFYEQTIKCQLAIYRSTKNESIKETAFNTAQRASAYTLRTHINEKKALDLLGIEITLQEDYLNLKRTHQDLKFEMMKNYTDSLFSKTKEASDKLEVVRSEILHSYPKFEELTSKRSITPFSDIQSNIPNDVAMIQYFMGRDSIYTFYLTKSQMKVYTYPNDDKIKNNVNKYRAMLSSTIPSSLDSMGIISSYTETSFTIYKALLKDILEKEDIQKLILVPGSYLSNIPFEALMISESDNWDNPDDFLISKYDISYLYYCGQILNKKPEGNYANFLSFGLEYDTYTLDFMKKEIADSIPSTISEKFRSEELSHLYFADDEAQELADMFEGKYLINQKATRENFINEYETADILHISAHSLVDLQTPENSSIIFNKSDTEDNNLLSMIDIYKLNISADLTTLSACNTSYGKQMQSEGVSSLSRAFIESGSKSVLGSIWSVPDEISKKFMTHFYANLKKGHSKDKALKLTKIAFMTDDDLVNPLYRNPAYWSSWVLCGDTSPIVTKSNNWMWIVAGFTVFILGGLLYRTKQS